MDDGYASRRFHAFAGDCEIHSVGLTAETLEWAERWTLLQHQRFTRFEPTSELSRFNQSAGLGWQDVSPDLEAMLKAGSAAYERTGGLVHIAVVPALVGARPLPELLSFRPGQARLVAGAAVDLGGIAKGWLADHLCSLLGGNVLVNFCGDLFAAGSGPDGAGWAVGFGGQTLALEDRGAATSATHRGGAASGPRHLIDPRTGAPGDVGLTEVSVIADSATEAEVLAKAALLLGRANAEAWLASRSYGWWIR